MNLQDFRLTRCGIRLPPLLRGGPLGYLEVAGWWARGILWVEGWLTSTSREPLAVRVALGGGRRRFELPRFCFSREDLRGIPGAAGQIFLLPIGEAAGDRHTLRALHVLHSGKWYRWTLHRGMAIAPDLAPHLEEKLPMLSPEILADLRDFIGEVSRTHLGLDLASDSLFRRNISTVEGLSNHGDRMNFRRLPPCIAAPNGTLGLCADRLIAIDSETSFLSGWLWDAEEEAESLALTMPGADYRRNLLDSAARVERRDICDQYLPAFGQCAEGKHGFIAFVEDRPLGDRHRLVLELRTRQGRELRVGMPEWIRREPFSSRDEVLRFLPDVLSTDRSLIEDHLHPALERLQNRCRRRAAIDRSFTFGTLPRSPSTSIILPLFERLDLMQYQLAEFADDPGMRGCELIFVLDSPRLELDFEKNAFHLARLYRLPIRGLVLSHNAGYAAAVRLAATEARGRRLVLMHSDVFADRQGWLSELEEFYDARPSIGALGPKLLYEDHSIQHAGLYFTRDHEPGGLWTTVSYYHGLPRRHPRAEAARRVPAVSGACLMIRRDLFEKVGGLRDIYVAGDLEDADLCLRCAEAGLESWYLPSVELYHLEAGSKQTGPGWRRNPWSRLYNRWLQKRTSDATIGALMESLGKDGEQRGGQPLEGSDQRG